jgi:hypothetical protein
MEHRKQVTGDRIHVKGHLYLFIFHPSTPLSTGLRMSGSMAKFIRKTLMVS